jgi:outer membrane protein TolC
MRLEYILNTILTLFLWVELLPAKPLTMADAVQYAIANHPQSQLAKAIVEEAQGERRSTTALSAPKFFIRWDDIPSHQNITDFEERRVGISQDFDFPLQYIWRARIADLSVVQAQNESRAILLDLESDVRQAYLEAWFLAEQTKVLKDYSDTLGIYCAHIQEMGKHGEYSPLDAREYALAARQAEIEYHSSNSSRIAALEKLAHLTGCAHDELELVSPLESDPIDTTRFTVCDATLENPQISAAETEVRVCGLKKTLANNSWLPELQLTYFERVRLDRTDRNSWAFELEMTIPVWFWWDGAGRIQASQAKLNRAIADLAVCQLELTSACACLAQEIRSVYEQYELYQREVLPLAREKFQLARRNVQLGGADYGDFIDAWKELKKTLLEDAEIKSELYQSVISYDRLIGNSIAGKSDKSPSGAK